MADPEWGKKRKCQNCNIKYYDLQKEPATCPKCGTVYRLETTQRGRRSRQNIDVPKPIPITKTASDETDLNVQELKENSVDDDETLPDDANELGGEDDVSNVMDSVETERDDN